MDSLAKKYSDALEFASKVLTLRDDLVREAFWWPLRHFEDMKKFFRDNRHLQDGHESFAVWNLMIWSPIFLERSFSGRLSPFMRAYFRTVATPEQRANDLFDHLVSEYSTEALAEELVRQVDLKPNQLPALASMHKTMVASARAPWNWLAIVVTAGTLVARMIPKESFQAVRLESVYPNFQLTVTIAMLTILLYVALVILPGWLRIRRLTRHSRYCGQLLEYSMWLRDFIGSDEVQPQQNQLHPEKQV